MGSVNKLIAVNARYKLLNTIKIGIQPMILKLKQKLWMILWQYDFRILAHLSYAVSHCGATFVVLLRPAENTLRLLLIQHNSCQNVNSYLLTLSLNFQENSKSDFKNRYKIKLKCYLKLVMHPCWCHIAFKEMHWFSVIIIIYTHAFTLPNNWWTWEVNRRCDMLP